MAKVTEGTVKNYINDAAKYAKSKLNGAELLEKIYLQVDNMKGVSKEVLDYAKNKKVTIIDNFSKLPGL
ncbi:hypothetical protein [Gilliamella sp. G0441]|uniref:hypothetical protein n=1 Tax=Gilliamella sp. G0441 TaxID=3384760 RepID=UPI003D3454AE